MARQVNWFTEGDVRRWDRRQVLKLGAGAAVTAALAGRTTNALAGSAAAGVSEVGEGKTIGLILNGFNVYDQCLATGVLKGLAGTKYGFIGLQGNFDAAQEVDNFDTMISRGVNGIIVIPNTVQGASRGALAAKSKGIPVVNVLWSDPTPADSAYVARVRADNIRGGNLMAQWITKNTDPGEIVVVVGVPGQGFSEKLLQGLKEGLDVYGEGKWKIVGIQPGFFTRTTAIKAAQNLLTAHPKAKIVVDFAAEMGNGIASYLKKAGKTDIVNITSDGNEEMVPLIRSGGIKAVRYYSSGQEGLVGAQLMRKYLEKRQRTPGIVDLKQGMVTSADINQWVKEQPLCYDQYHGRVSKIG